VLELTRGATTTRRPKRREDGNEPQHATTQRPLRREDGPCERGPGQRPKPLPCDEYDVMIVIILIPRVRVTLP
jgi:hypothetical protein